MLGGETGDILRHYICDNFVSAVLLAMSLAQVRIPGNGNYDEVDPKRQK